MSNDPEHPWTHGPWKYDQQDEVIYPAAASPVEYIAKADPASGPLMALAPEMGEAIMDFANERSDRQPLHRMCDIADKLSAIIDEACT